MEIARRPLAALRDEIGPEGAEVHPSRTERERPGLAGQGPDLETKAKGHCQCYQVEMAMCL